MKDRYHELRRFVAWGSEDEIDYPKELHALLLETPEKMLEYADALEAVVREGLWRRDEGAWHRTAWVLFVIQLAGRGILLEEESPVESDEEADLEEKHPEWIMGADGKQWHPTLAP